MDTIIRGPNLPPSVVGSLEGHFHISFTNWKVFHPIGVKCGRIVFWGLPPTEFPSFDVVPENSNFTVVCPVTTHYELFVHYLKECAELELEFLKSKYIMATAVMSVVKHPTVARSTPVEVDIIGKGKGEIWGSFTVSYWFVRHPGSRSANQPKRKAQIMRYNLHKKRMALCGQIPKTRRTISDLFEGLEESMSCQGIRLIDMFRVCNKLKTPVVDLASLLDRHVDGSITDIVRSQFWLLISTDGGVFFTFADFHHRFKIAQRAIWSVNDQIESGTTILRQLNRVIKRYILEEDTSEKRFVQLTAAKLNQYIKETFPDASDIDAATVLAFTMISFPDRLYWTLNEIGIALDQGLQLKIKKKEESPKTELSLTMHHRKRREIKANVTSDDQTEGNVAKEVDTEVKEELQTVDERKEEIKVEQNGRELKEASSVKGASLNKDIVLRELWDRVLPGKDPALRLKQMPRGNDSVMNVEARQLKRTLDSLISSCEEVLRDMNTAKENRILSARPVYRRFSVQQGLVIGEGPVAPHNPIEGMSDDPNILKEDIYFSTFLEKTKSYPSLLPYPKIQASSRPEKEVIESAPPMTMRWIKMVLKELRMKKGGKKKMIVRSMDFFVEFLLSQEPSFEVVWVPYHTITMMTKLCIVIEFHLLAPHQASDPGHSFIHASKCELCVFAGSGISFTKIEVVLSNGIGDGGLVSNTYPIKSLFSGDIHGSLEIELSHHEAKETSNLPVNMRPMDGGALQDSESCGNRVDTQTQTDLDKNTRDEDTFDEEDDIEETDEKISKLNSSKRMKRQDGREQKIILKVAVHSIQLNNNVEECFLYCCLEQDAESCVKSEKSVRSENQPERMLFDFVHNFTVTNSSDHWFDQSLIFKVMDLTEAFVGELHLDLSSLPRFHRICGPLGLLDSDLNKIGDIQIDVELQTNDHESKEEKTLDLSDSVDEERLLQKKAPLLTCSDDDNYVVIGGVGEPTRDEDLEEIDDLCMMFANKANISKDQERLPMKNVSDLEAPFHCDDQFLLDFSKHEDFKIEHLLERENSIEQNEDDDDISIERVSSDQLGNQSSWKFSNVLPPIKHDPIKEEEQKDQNESTDNVDIDALLEKYSLQRTPGWWKALISEKPSNEQTNVPSEEEQKSDHTDNSDSF